MFKKIDIDVLDTLIQIYEDLKGYGIKHSKSIFNLYSHTDDRKAMILSFIDNYSAIYFEGLSDSNHMSIDEIKSFIGNFDEEDYSDERCSNKDILTSLIGLYYDIDNKILEYGEDVCKEHLKGLIQRRNSIELYIHLYAASVYKKFKKKDVPVEELFKLLHGIYPVPFQIKMRKEHL